MNTIGERIALLRKNAHMTQAELMKKLEFDNLGKYETNTRMPNIDVIIKLSDFFNVSADWILVGVNKTDCKNEAFNDNNVDCEQCELSNLTDDVLECVELFQKLSPEDRIRILERMHVYVEEHGEFSPIKSINSLEINK